MFDEQIKGVRFLVDKVQFGSYIREKRTALGLSQEELAEQLYISATAISKWENGKTYPDITIISQICNVLNISEHEFVSACDDTELRKQAFQAQKYRKISTATKWTANIIFAIPVLICFICNLAISQNLTWFWTTTASLAIAYSILVLPFMVEKEKSLFAVGGATISTILTIIFAYIFADQFFALGRGLLLFGELALIPWAMWAVCRFTKQGLSLSFFIAAVGYFLTLFIDSNTADEVRWIDFTIMAGLIAVGVVCWFVRKKKK
jgi:transcriptional regulator with XRE-family HTH domain